MRRKPPLFGCFCGGVATASPLKANIQSDETAEYTVPLDDVVHITAGAPAESQQVESHHQPAGAEEACVVLPPICKDKLPSVYGRGCQESPVATELSSISSLSYDSPLASGSAKSGNTPMWQNSRGGQGSAMGGRQNGIFFDNPLSITGGGDESPASVAQPTADAENTHMLCSQGQPPEAEITTASCNVPAEAAAASPAPHESPDVADEAPGTTHTNADDGCDGGTDTSSPGQTDRGKKSHERTTSGSLLPSLISEAEVAALEEWEPSVDCPYSAEVPSTNKVMQRSPKSVSKLDSEEGPIEPSCSPALTSILNEYLENDVPLTHRQRFPSTAVGSEDIDEKGSHASSPLSTTSTYYSRSTAPDTVHSPTSSMRRSLSYATTGIRQSLETKQESPVKCPSLVPSLRLSALDLGKVKDSAENGREMEVNSLNSSAGYNPPLLVRSGITEDTPGGMFEISEPAGKGTQEAAEGIKKGASLPLAKLKPSPLGKASRESAGQCRINSPVKIPSSRSASPHNSIRINRLINESPKNMVESPLAASDLISNPAMPKHMLGSDAFSLRMNAMEQSRQFSLKGAAAVASTSSPGGNRRRRARNTASSLKDEENLVPKSVSPSNQNTMMDWTDGSIKGTSDACRGTEHGNAEHKLSADVRDSLVEIGGCDFTCETPMTCDETPALEACQNPAVLPQSLERGLEQRATGRQRQKDDELELVHPNPEEVPEHVQAAGCLVHNNAAFASITDGIVIQPHEVDDMESEEGGSIVAWEASTELSESKPPQESRLDGPEGPAASEEPHVRGSRRCWLDKPLERVNPLRKEMAHEKSLVAKKSLASTGSFSLYGNKAFQEQQEESSTSGSVLKAGASSPSPVRCSQILRSLTDIVAARSQGLAPEQMENNGGSTAHILEDAVFSSPGHELALPDEPISGGAAKEITPLIDRAPAPAGLTLRAEVLTPNGLLHGRSLGSTFDLLANGDAHSKEAAAGALCRIPQQECHKMPMCRLYRGLEVANGNEMAAWALKGLMSQNVSGNAVLRAGGIQAFLSVLRSPNSTSAGPEAATWAIKVVTDPPGSSRFHLVLEAGGLSTLLVSLSSSQASLFSKEGATRALWNLIFQEGHARAELTQTHNLTRIARLLMDETATEVCQAEAGVLWNLSSNPATRQNVFSTGGPDALLKAVAACGNGNDAGFASVRELCLLSEEPDGAEALVSAGALEILEKRPSPGEGKPAPRSNALVVAIDNCLQASSALSNRPSGTDEFANAVSSLKRLKEQCNDGQLLVDLFVDYDCDPDGSNLFERMLSGLVATAQCHKPQADSNKQQGDDSEALLQSMATECLVTILKALLAWYEDGAPPQEKAGEADADSPDSSMRHAGRHESVGSLGTPSSAAAEAETSESSPKSSTGADSVAHEWEVVESKEAYNLGFQEGVALFNKEPKKGVAFMQEQGMLGESPGDVACFLGKTMGLNKTMVGDYLGERDDACIKVVHEYVDAMDFTGMEFDDAIRKFLADFRLPGEAQKIDCLMEKFAERYFLCNPDSFFKSADVAYELAFSVIVLNTNAHNPMVQVKISKDGFFNNNRGINDGDDLPADYLSALYDRIVNNEIQTKETDSKDSDAKGWVDTVMAIIGRKAVDYAEPIDDTIRRTHEYPKETAKGATFSTATGGETVRPMVDVAWAPMLGAFSVLFEDSVSQELCTLCLEGFLCAISLTSTLGMTMLRDAFVTSLSRLTSLHSPAHMSLKSVHALRTLIKAAEFNGNNFQGAWPEVLRCISKYDLLVQQHSGAPGDNILFAPPGVLKRPKTENQKSRKGLFGFRWVSSSNDVGPMSDTDFTMQEQREAIATSGDRHIFVPQDRPMTLPSVLLSGQECARAPGRQKAAQGEPTPAPPPRLLEVIDAQELNHLYVNSDRLNSTAIVEFVSALSIVSLEELSNVAHPRVFGLTKIVEIAHFNMTRIRLVWTRIWGVLSDYFITVGCHQNLSVAILAVDYLRQLAMKFLELDELANYNFQNDFLRPFVVVMRQSNSLEIRELIIRCVSQIVLARVAHVKSGWKSMFMVFTTAAQDDAQAIVRLSMEKIEKIVREHFAHTTEMEKTTCTDYVNCLIAFANNPHSLDVALNAIALLRFCAMKLADGAISSVDDLPGEAVVSSSEVTQMTEPGIECLDTDKSTARFIGSAARISETDSLPMARTASQGRLYFIDKDEHMSWFPLLAGLSKLTFDPRPNIRYSALEVLFDILRHHGKCFSPSFWDRVFDGVIFPMFDDVRAEVTDDGPQADEDKWRYDTCTKCLQHLVDLFCHFFSVVNPMLGRLLDLLACFIRRTHQSLAAVGVAALGRLISDAGSLMHDAQWVETLQAVRATAMDTLPQVADLVWHPSSTGDFDRSMEDEGAVLGEPAREWSLSQGLGARRLAEVQCRAAVQLLLVQAAGEVYALHCRRLPTSAVVILLDILREISTHARVVDGDRDLGMVLAQKQAGDGVQDDRAIQVPPLMKLESEASHSYLSVLLYINMAPSSSDTKASAHVGERLVELCIANLQGYEEVVPFSGGSEQDGASNISMATSSAEQSVRAPLVVATLRALVALGDDEFRRHLQEFFPLLARLISCQHAPAEVKGALSSLFDKRIGPLLM